uniref:Uncharacterized protein n=1 Tax=Heterosigma akashiwo TaxID=2829 RepID=A0A7S3XXC8_HETAK
MLKFFYQRLETPTKKRNSSKSRSSSNASSTGRNLAEYEAFIGKLKRGYAVLKHGRMGKPKPRVLQVSEDLTHLSWQPEQKGGGATAAAASTPRYTALLDTVEEVRGTGDADRDQPHLLATAVLRRSLRPEHAGRALSVVWPHRTLDLEFGSEAECQEVLHGLRELLAEVGHTTFTENPRASTAF